MDMVLVQRQTSQPRLPPHEALPTTTLLLLSLPMPPVRAFNFEPSPGDKSRPSKLALSLPTCHHSMEGRAKAASLKGQTLSAPAHRTGWESGSDLLQRKLDRWCQLVDIPYWISHQAQGKEHGTRVSGCKACPSWATNRLRELLPPVSVSGPQLLTASPDENACSLLRSVPARMRGDEGCEMALCKHNAPLLHCANTAASGQCPKPDAQRVDVPGPAVRPLQCPR